ncbi:WhiB family transcriptional regulator [Streptomyces sp. NPDC006610]|uniref:WhiB family transcriptional regulator n=1 Tax=Streptomyces sp. NPDC006610 TaxID=3154584 RepID=UPI0033AD02BF
MSAGRSWLDQALCAQIGPHLWTDVPKGGGYAEARRICQRCPVLAACEAHADRLARQGIPVDGMWAGKTSRQRRRRQQIGEAA